MVPVHERALLCLRGQRPRVRCRHSSLYMLTLRDLSRVRSLQVQSVHFHQTFYSTLLLLWLLLEQIIV